MNRENDVEKCLTIQIIWGTLKLEHTFSFSKLGVLRKMSENKMELLKLILENDNPEQALLLANAIILDAQKQDEATEVQTAACL